jgi:nucleoside phosphorylase
MGTKKMEYLDNNENVEDIASVSEGNLFENEARSRRENIQYWWKTMVLVRRRIPSTAISLGILSVLMQVSIGLMVNALLMVTLAMMMFLVTVIIMMMVV